MLQLNLSGISYISLNIFCKKLSKTLLTLAKTLVLAPLINRISTTSILPFLTALNNGVLLFYKYNTK